jgi:2-polyprenyl-6-methoxyphenol hydroxylase-like FAD-dependent oxidoreductase
MRVVICGAGIAGLTLANRLWALGVDVTVLEQAPAPRDQGYMIDFFGPGYDAIKAMGLLPKIERVAYRVAGADFVDEQGHRRVGVSLDSFAVGPLLSIMRPDLERVLREQLRVDIRFGVSPIAVTERHDSVGVTLDDGTELEADLLVGADGIHSTVRRLVFGDESRFFRYLGFHTTAFTFDSPKIHATVGGRACLTDTIGRQMGFYALRNGRVAAFGVHRTPDLERPHDIRSTLREVYGGLGWVVPEALDRCPPAGQIFYDQLAQIVMPTWSTERVVLVGDAGYAVSLLAGQGASLGIAGAYVLADQLGRTQSIGQALVHYEKLWRPVAEEKQKAGRASGRWFAPKSDVDLKIRRMSLRMAGLPVVNRRLAARLTGRSNDLVSNLAG